MSHTAGPWRVVRRTAIEKSVRIAEHFAVAPQDGPMFAFLPLGRLDIQDANARFIAAAPDLLEAAKDTVKRHDKYCPEDQRKLDLVAGLRLAIAKAEGKL